MPERPILVFPTPEPSIREKKRHPHPSITIPTHDRLIVRQRPKFATLVRGFREGLFDVRQTATGLEPEKALVIEINGEIANFFRLCEQTDGFDFIADINLEEIVEDPDYPDTKKGKLILSTVNTNGLRELLSLWNRFKRNKNVKFPRGKAQWKNVFNQLEDIRFWGVKDRLEETYALDNWIFEVQTYGKEVIQTEVELFYKESANERGRREAEVEALCNELYGEILKKTLIPEIRYHGLLISLPRDAVDQIAANRNTNLVKCDYIMYFRPTGQSVSVLEDSDFVDEESLESEMQLDESRLALLDGLPIQNHEKIKNHINIVDPDGFEENYLTASRKHGTSMASLIINGDLEDTTDNFLPKSAIYLRPILKYDPDKDRELIPEGELFIDLVHRAVVEMKDEEARDETKQASVQVINLSVCDPMRLFHWELSSLARLLDWLSWKYNVLFIVSAGNHSDRIRLIRGINGNDLPDLPVDQKREVLFKRLHEIQRFRRLMAPSESINSITVGGMHDDNASVNGNVSDLIGSDKLPASYNPISYGFRKAVKPEIFCSGGRSVFRLTPHDTDYFDAELYTGFREPGHKVAFPSSNGNTRGYAYTRGTSNATALASRNALKIIEMLDELNSGDEVLISKNYYPVVVKNLLVHSCAWNNSYEYLKRILKTDDNKKDFHKVVQRYIGHGISKIERSLECIQNRATVIGVGTLNKDEGQRFRIPIPQCFNDTRVDRRIILTLSWLTPLNMAHAFYRKAHLTMEMGGVEELTKYPDKEAHADSIVKGTVEHRVFKSRSKVSLSGNEDIFIKITCREDAGTLDDPIRYALAVTIENLTNVDLPVYEQVRDRIGVRIRPRV